MAGIDPRNTPEVNPQVLTDFQSNLERSPYASTTEDLLDRIRKGIENWPGTVNVGTLNIHTREGSGFVLGFDATAFSLGQIVKVMAWMEVIRDPSTGDVISLEFFDQPGGPIIPEGLLFIRPVNQVALTFQTYRIDGNISSAALPWIDEFTLGQITLPGITGSAGNILDLPFQEYRFMDIIILPTSSGDESVLPAGQVGFWADKAKTRFYPVNYVDAVGPVSIKRGSPTMEGFLAQNIYIEATPGCQLEVTIAY